MGTANSLLDLLPATLRYERRELPAEQNALGPWQEALACRGAREPDGACQELIYGVWGEDDVKAAPIPTGEARERVDLLLEENRRAFDLLDEGLARGRLQFPLPTGSEAVDLPQRMLTFDVGSLGRLRFVRAKLLAADGKLDAAAAEFAAVWAMGRLIAYGEGKVWKCIAGAWLRNAGLAGLERDDVAAAVGRDITDALVAECAAEHATAGGVITSLKVELHGFLLTCLQTFSDGDAEAVIDSLLATLYPDRVMEWDLCHDEARVPEELQRQRVAQRRELLLTLVEGHPHLFDRVETTRLLAHFVEQHIASLKFDPDSRLVRLRERVVDRWRRMRDRRARQLSRAWPESLSPIALEWFGDDELAVATRAQHLESDGESDFWSCLAPPSQTVLRDCRAQLRRIRNPVGMMVAGNLKPVGSRDLVWRYRRDLAAARRAIAAAR